MSEMYVREPEPKIHIIDEYDFVLANGSVLTYNVDKDAGDQMTTEGTLIHIQLVAKRSLMDPAVMNPPEDVVINRAHVALMYHRTRQVQELTADQQQDWLKTLEEASGTIQ